MKLKFPVLIIAIFFLSGKILYSQTVSQKKREVIVKDFINAFNDKNYRLLKKDFFFLGKILVSEKKMEEGFSEIYNMLGNLEIIKITHPTLIRTEAEFTSSKNPGETEAFNFSFNKKDNITTVWLKNPNFIYPKNNIKLLTKEQKVAQIDSLTKVNHLKGNFNGCVLAIDDGEIIYKGSFGYSDFENKIPLNDSTVFCLASLSKQFTAIGIMMLAEKNKLTYSDYIIKYLPELPKKFEKITIEHLLTHTSGVPDYMNLFKKYWDKTKVASNDDVIKMLNQYKPKLYFKPGSSFSYSNTGYVLLASIIEKVSGIPFSEYLKRNIFEPLSMKNTYVQGLQRKNNASINNYAYGYVYSDSLQRYTLIDNLPKYDFTYYLNSINGDGSVNSTILDLAVWDAALRTEKLVTKNSLEKAHSLYKLKNGRRTYYGYGMFVEDGEEIERVAYHSGGWPGYHTFILRFLDKNKTVIILSNNEYLSFNKMADKIASILIK